MSRLFAQYARNRGTVAPLTLQSELSGDLLEDDTAVRWRLILKRQNHTLLRQKYRMIVRLISLPAVLVYTARPGERHQTSSPNVSDTS